MVYTVEYAKSGRAGCKACGEKILKAKLRIGKSVMLDMGQYGIVWHHYNCFWILKEPNDGWTCFTGISQLRLEDQQTLHQKVTGRTMPQEMVEEASAKISEANTIKEKDEAEAAAAAAAFTSSSPSTILYTFLQKHVDMLKVPELKAACAEHGLKLEKKAKRVDIVKLIMDQKIEKVSGLAYHGVKKNCTAQELKEILKNCGLGVSGTKEDLIGRLLESQGAAPPPAQLISASQAAPKEKKRKWDFDSGDYYFSGHDMYKKDEEDRELVRVARGGTLAQLEAELVKLPAKDKAKRAAKLNHARRWTEVEEKWGYDKSWEWFGDTAITAAARRGQVEMVAALLAAGADPTLEACPSDDVTEDAVKAAQSELKKAEAAVREVEEGRMAEYRLKMYQDPANVAKELLVRRERAKKLLDLLMMANNCWSRATYAGVSYSDERSKAFVKNPNMPTDQVKLKQEIEDFDKQIKVDESKLNQLKMKYEELQQKNRSEEQKRQEEERQRRDFMEQSRKKRNEEVNRFNPNAESFHPGVKWQPTHQLRPDVVFQFEGAASKNLLEPDNKRTKFTSAPQECASARCTNVPAKACPQRRCYRCCSGPCARHRK